MAKKRSRAVQGADVDWYLISIDRLKQVKGIEDDLDLTAGDFQALVDSYKGIVREHADDPVRLAIEGDRRVEHAAAAANGNDIETRAGLHGVGALQISGHFDWTRERARILNGVRRYTVENLFDV